MVTNFHVIEGATSAVVKFPDGAFYFVEGVLAGDRDRDIAVLKIEASGKEFPFLPLGNSERVVVGEHVVAIGSPLAQEATVSDGIVSGLREEKELGRKVIQITAPISHGSSGGPLLNLRGEVIGITTFGLWPGQNLNFAIPANYMAPLIVGAPVKPFSQFTKAHAREEGGTDTLADLEGTYTGVWQSDRYGFSGATALTVRIQGDFVRGEVVLTGSPVGYKGDTLLIKVRKLGAGVWTAECKGEHSSLSATGIFKAGKFVGDFRFRYRLSVDRGRWILQKQ